MFFLESFQKVGVLLKQIVCRECEFIFVDTAVKKAILILFLVVSNMVGFEQFRLHKDFVKLWLFRVIQILHVEEILQTDKLTY